MKIKNTILFFLIVFCSGSVFSQSIEEVKSNRQVYIWGEGNGITLEKARKAALDMLVNQISVQVESSYQQTISQENKANAQAGSFSEKVNSIVKTYSNATLTNVEQILLSEEPDAKVFLYLKKTEVSKIFTSRKQKILDNISLAYKFEQKLQIADALRLYYWSLLLLKSHPDCQSMMFTPPGESKEISLISWLPARINDVFGNIQFRVTDITKENDLKTVQLEINYKDQPVSNLDFCFWDGRNYSQVQGTTNGQTSLELLGASALLDNVKIKAEYVFEYQARIDKELESIMEKIDPIAYSKSYYNIKTNEVEKGTAITILKSNALKTALTNSVQNINTPQHSNQVETGINQTANHPAPISSNSTKSALIPGEINEQNYQSRINRIIEAIRTKNYASAQKMFTSEAFDNFNRLVKMGNAKVIGKPQIKAYSFDGDVMCRPVPMVFAYANNNRKFSDDVVFHFNKDTIINNITFGLNNSALNSITSNPKYAVKDQLTIINFLENYKTAFALKRIDYLESIFADDALIIVGQYVKTANNVESPYANNKIVRYNKMNKQTYIKNLKQAFESQEFINIVFEDSRIQKTAKGGDIYGIEIKQNYYSSSYGDQGYLFLMVDLNADPLIHIRAWQPEKGANGRTIDTSDF